MDFVANFDIETVEFDAVLEVNPAGAVWGSIQGDITEQTDLQNALNDKQDTLTAGEGISIEDNVISNTQTSAEWGNIEGDIADQTDLTDLINTEVGEVAEDLGIEETARINADTALQGEIDTINGTTINGNAIGNGNITLTASDVGALPDSTTIGNGTLTIQKNGSTIDTFGANDTGNKTVNITVPITASDVNALPDTTKYAASLSLAINSSTYVVSAQLKDQNGDNLGTAQTIDLPLESVVVGGSYDSTNKKVVLTLQNGSTIEFSVADLVSGLQTEITSSNKLDADLVDDSTSTNKFATASQLAQIGTNQTNIGTINNTIGGYGDIVTHDTDEFATAAQGDLADTAIQPADLSTVATTGDYDDLLNKPTIPSVGNGKLTIQRNNIYAGEFTANQTANSTVNITVPTKTSDITNDSFYLSMLQDWTQPVLTSNGTMGGDSFAVDSNSTVTDLWKAFDGDSTTSVTFSGEQSYDIIFYNPVELRVTEISFSYVSQSIGYNIGVQGSNDGTNYTFVGGFYITGNTIYVTANEDWKYYKVTFDQSTEISEISITAKSVKTLSTVAYSGSYTDLSDKPTIPAAQVNSDWNASSGVAQILNKPTIPAVGDGTITINQGGVQKGTFTTNQSGNTTIDLDAGGGSSTDVQINGTSIVSNDVANIVTNTAYNASSNKIATMSDLPNVANMQTTTNLVTSLSASSTDTQYPSAKCVYDIVGDIETALNTINSGV